MSTENYRQIKTICDADVQQLVDKGKFYGRSWIKRGGIGAFMMLARKWDRVENMSESCGYDVLEALMSQGEKLLDDIGDLRRYLLLVESEYRDRVAALKGPEVEYHADSNIPIK